MIPRAKCGNHHRYILSAVILLGAKRERVLGDPCPAHSSVVDGEEDWDSSRTLNFFVMVTEKVNLIHCRGALMKKSR
jgi:hypothetical protein